MKQIIDSLIDRMKDLEQENKQLKEQLQEQIDYKDEYYHYWQETKKENTILKKALEEKDKEINKLSKEHFELFGDMKDYKNLWLAEQRKNKEIREQVCDEIREKLKKQILPAGGNWLAFYDVKETNDLLDQIEQAKESIDGKIDD